MTKLSKKTATGKSKTPIDTTPTTNETVVFSWGRMNPPTKGHEKLVEVMESLEGDKIIHLSHSELTKRNPLSYSQKLEYTKLAFGDIIQESESRNIATSLEELGQRYKHLVLVVGEDRIEEFSEMLENYSNDFGFEYWEIVSAGTRRPDSDGHEGISASSLRESCVTRNLGEVTAALPTRLEPFAEEIMNTVKDVYTLSESIKTIQKVRQKKAIKNTKDILSKAIRK